MAGTRTNVRPAGGTGNLDLDLDQVLVNPGVFGSLGRRGGRTNKDKVPTHGTPYLEQSAYAKQARSLLKHKTCQYILALCLVLEHWL